MTKVELIKDYLNDCKEEEIDFIYDLLNLPYSIGKDHLLKLAGINPDEHKGKIDYAVPIQSVRVIEEVYKPIRDANLIFDYRNNSAGEFLNINDAITKRIIEVFRAK